MASLLPAYPDTALARQVRVQQFLTHTGGTGDFFGAVYDAHAAGLQTLAGFIRLFGTREASLERSVFLPAGMKATSPAAAAGNTALPCTGAARTGLRPLPFYAGLSAGSGSSTIDDLHRLGMALRATRLLESEKSGRRAHQSGFDVLLYVVLTRS